MRHLTAASFAFVLAGAPACGWTGELGVNVYGLSYHFERDRARALRTDNELNPGLGLRYRFAESGRTEWFADAGAYRDSGRNTAVLAAVGGYWKATPGLRLGAALVVFDSETYNRGRAFVAPIPVAAYHWRSVTVNLAYLPKWDTLNEINTLGFWVTFWPGWNW
jgi:hypothetical protein